MDYQKYYEAREIIKEILEKDLLGPLIVDEVIKDYPVVYYIAGKLYPQNCPNIVERSSSEDIGDLDEENNITLDNSWGPASMGLSFSLSKSAKEIIISARAALYTPKEEFESETKKILWQRIPLELTEQKLSVKELQEQRTVEYWLDENLKLIISLHRKYADGSKSVTATLINTNIQTRKESRFWVNQHTYFQPEIIIKGENSAFTDVRKSIKIDKDKEVQEMELLYSKYRNYVTGHGCAADYKEENENIILYTSVLPIYELKRKRSIK